ncbi:folate-binding protein [Orrella sp. JC864]|uniref:CAF17-like 4Fe-4S cluster assembly/insertion protein YgfZ n=1 Tax=Orrella sp. JC864 TaxID=3120298 RepID=UPI00300AEC22
MTASPAPLASFIAPLPAHAVISASGADALAFLHGQLTNDVIGLGPQAARLGGYCTAKGRLLASMVYWHAQPAQDGQPPTVLMLVRRDLAEALLKRLRMFVLRAKVVLALTDLQVHGVQAAGDAARQALRDALQALPGQAPWQRTELPGGTWIAAPAAGSGVSRWWWIASPGQAQAGAALPLPAAPAQAWHEADIAAGLPWIGAPTQDLFIPQTVNLDLIEGVSFNKGCYPGQEVVARSHYRGTVKRRMGYGRLAAGAQAALQAGTDIYQAGQPDEPCGRVVDAAGDALLFEAPLPAQQDADLRLGAADGPAIAVQALPYPLAKAQ